MEGRRIIIKGKQDLYNEERKTGKKLGKLRTPPPP
jgi:hypothetical protein